MVSSESQIHSVEQLEQQEQPSSSSSANIRNSASSPTPTDDPPPSACTAARGATLGVLLLTVAGIITDSLTSKAIPMFIEGLLEWTEENPGLGVLVFALFYAVATVLFIPGSLLTLGAGFAFTAAVHSPLYGTLLGTAAVFLGATTGSLCAFLLARYLFRDLVTSYLEREKLKGTSTFALYWSAIDAAMSKQGLKIMVLLRLSPLIPFNALNYVAGTTAITFKAYAVAMLGILPGTTLFVYLGATAGDLASAEEGDTDEDGENGEMVKNIALGVGACFGLAAVVFVSYFAKKELNKSLEEAAKTEGKTVGESLEEGQKC